MANYFNFPNNKKKKSEITDHSVFAEELLVPFLNHSDAYRINMFSSHFSQLVHLKTPEYPKVFTNFENQVGEYSLSYKKADDDCEIIAKIKKNELNYDLIVRYKSTGVYDYIPVRYAAYITEEYGSHMDDCISDKEVGSTIKKGEFIFKAPNYDDEGNFSYGVNLKTCYHQFEGLTDEDAVVISESAANKLVSYKVEETFISVNTNDILLNIYPTEEYGYHSIPKVGEHTLGRILCASRRQDSSTALYTFQHDRMREISETTDDITYSNGAMVADMDIYCNIPIEQMRKRRNEFNREVVSLLEEQHRYYKELAAVLETIIPVAKEEQLLSVMSNYEKAVYDNERKEYGYHFARPLPKQLNENKYSDSLAFAWKQAHEYLDNRIKWRVDGKAFHNLKIRFLLVKENPVTVGLKLTGRLTSGV